MAISSQAYNRRALEKPVAFSQAVRAGDFLFISGCVSWDMEGNVLHPHDFPKQVETVYADIDATLKANGMDASHIVKETVYTRDMDGMVAANPKRVEYYKDVTPPASTWIEIKRLVHPDMFLEVEITAYKGS
ncbi:RidA family protein [Mesorhizobium sp. CO1-1-8]|uniref:RidA family protein n=1 Tax=Mesorhizobium sp. CO1-1-8 TaxID=2876631 RepID=UPI001CD0460C|nr:RidA family protein [Mesorhizobium sp. CO1-1-8]MBZ9772455.1 RidA family protein [Mesorhizobium sp. CO1-1-8]